MKRFHLVGILLSCCVLNACSSIYKPSFIQNRDKQYLSAKSIPPLAIPPGISSSAFESYYPVPYRQYPESTKIVTLYPPGLNR